MCSLSIAQESQQCSTQTVTKQLHRLSYQARSAIRLAPNTMVISLHLLKAIRRLKHHKTSSLKFNQCRRNHHVRDQ